MIDEILYNKTLRFNRIDENLLDKSTEFPIMKPLPLYHDSGVIKRTKNFFTLKRQWQIKEESCIYSPLLKQFIYIPNEFIIDGASVPKVLHGFFGAIGILFYGSIPHDFAYRYKGLLLVNNATKNIYFKGFSKSEADHIFKDICLVEQEKRAVSITVAKTALSFFGFTGWNSNRKMNRNLIEDFPELFWKRRSQPTSKTKQP